MSENKENVPKIRFPGFDGVWERRKIGEVIENYVEKTVVQNQYPVLTSSQQQGIVLQEDYFADRRVTTNDNIGYYVLPKGYFTYRSRSDTDVFVFNRNNLINKGIISYYYPVFKPKNIDSNFLLRRLNYGIKHQLAMAAEGTGQRVLSQRKFKNMTVSVPELQEQKQIGLLFEQLDHLITLHQRKLNNVQTLKAGLLQKMFPKNGEAFPEVRFSGFTHSWEQRRLKDIAEFNPKSMLPNEFEYVDLESVVGTDLIAHRTESKESAPSRAQRLAQRGDVFYQTVRPYQKNNYLYNLPYDNYVFSTGYAQMRPSIDSYFLLSRVQEERFVKAVLDRSTGTSYPAINSNDLAEIEIKVPVDSGEQEKIGSLFRSLDSLITLHQRKLEHLQQQKKSLLQQMFV
ncbi:restriction endonuclease subunit S [Bacillus sp. FSL W7-1360]